MIDEGFNVNIPRQVEAVPAFGEVLLEAEIQSKETKPQQFSKRSTRLGPPQIK